MPGAPGDPSFPPMPGGPSYGPGHRSDADRTNGLAVASLVTGLLGCFGVLGAILGAIALVQIGKRGGKGRGMAIAGIALSCVWIVGGVVIYSLVGGDDPGPKKGGGVGALPKVTVTKPKDVDAKKMKIGDCINDTTGTSASEQAPVEVESVKVVSCTAPHDGEVLATFRLTASTFPSERELSQRASSGCKRLMAPRLRRDPAAASLARSFYYPTLESWTAGDRMVTCVAVHATKGKKLTRRIHA
ncbi:DUF4190 domain-containing protein [Actinomadura roseirufa]|uniref:DUF4190 domain-containing protein n=1 Tax=Actinomadura roseirufa TaxID=2094049 RepID=UPI00104108E9|nr:DUF4190 domain-containing protein [Actinomadura roseirufa]